MFVPCLSKDICDIICVYTRNVVNVTWSQSLWVFARFYHVFTFILFCMKQTCIYKHRHLQFTKDNICIKGVHSTKTTFCFKISFWSITYAMIWGSWYIIEHGIGNFIVKIIQGHKRSLKLIFLNLRKENLIPDSCLDI